jgi:catechol 2,3-dioxygenase-like lactoylglutathione lyase family enzyme
MKPLKLLSQGALARDARRRFLRAMAASAGVAVALSVEGAPAIVRYADDQRGAETDPALGSGQLTEHICITVSDLERSINFYRDALGCQVGCTVRAEGPHVDAITEMPGCKIDSAFACLPGYKIELQCYREPFQREPLGRVSLLRSSLLRPNDPELTHVCLKVDDLDRVMQGISSARVEVVKGAGVSSPVYVCDPDGVVLVLTQYSPEARWMDAPLMISPPASQISL